jgi:hypothetical protein
MRRPRRGEHRLFADALEHRSVTVGRELSGRQMARYASEGWSVLSAREPGPGHPSEWVYVFVRKPYPPVRRRRT